MWFVSGWNKDNNGYPHDGADVERLISVVPDSRQLAFHEMEYYNFVHFGMNTFTNREWGDGTESPSLFNPTRLDTDQWCRIFKSTGSKGVIITAKHHDGFCLFDTAYTDHSVMHSPFGKDVVALLADSCRKYGLKLGIYLSPWDRHEAKYGTDAYNDYFVGQLTELSSKYGEIFCFWFDGACGEGPNGKKQVYDWERYYATIRRLQPHAVISVCGPDVRWIGNEGGKVRESEWSVIPAGTAAVEKVMDGSQQSENGAEELAAIDCYAEDNGSRDLVVKYRDLHWSPAEADVSVTTGWFYHPDEYYAEKGGGLRSAKELTDIYFNTVGGNASLLLNVPPDTRGLISDREIRILEECTDIIRRTLADKTDCTCYAVSDSDTMRPLENSGFVAADDEAALRLCFKNGKQTVAAVSLREDLSFSQRVEAFEIFIPENGKYCRIACGTVIGSRKIIRLAEPVCTDEVVIVFTQSRSNPHISAVTLCR